MSLRVIAEGVQTAEQATRLADSGCDYFQGYYFGRPMPVEQVALFVERREAHPASRAAAV